MSYNSPFSGAEVDDAVTKRHEKNKDTKLDEGGANETTAQETREHIDATDNPHGVTKTQVGLDDVDNVSAADLRDRSTHTGTQTLSTISDAGTIASQDANSVNIDGGTIDSTAVNATTLTASGDVNFDSGTLFVDESTDRVGIGTTLPNKKLTVTSQINDVEVLRINAAGGSGGVQGKADIGFGYFDTVAEASAAIGFEERSSASAGGHLLFKTRPNGASVSSRPTEAMRIESNGNVGIGTTSPSQKFHISGGKSIISSSDNSFGQFQIGNSASNGEASIGFISGVTQFGGSTTSTNGNSHIWAIGPSVYGIGGDTFGISNKSFSGSILNVTSSGNVGIGTTSPTAFSGTYLHINDANISRLKLTNDTTGQTNFDGSEIMVTDSDLSLFNRESGALAFSTSATERMRIDSSGNVGIGTTSPQAPLDISKSNGGTIVIFRYNSTIRGQMWMANDGPIFGREDCGLKFNSSYNTIHPARPNNGANRDNAIDLGVSSIRFDDIYATNGTIQTSDANEKQDIEQLTEAEQRVAQKAKTLLRKFRWKSAIEKKGEDARIHFGIIAQDLVQAFEDEELDAGRYAMFIKGEWWEDADGNQLEEYQDGAVKRERLGVRYSELLAFIISAI